MTWMKGAAFAALAFGAVACNDDDDDNSYLGGTDAEYKAVLESYVDYTIIPTYKALAEAALVMRQANEALKANPSDATMEAASDAWMDARIKWELSEAFLFGPVSEDGFDIDAHVDSWPLELIDIQREIAKGTITGAEAWEKEAEVIGFHVTEYLLYRNGESRPIADVTANELSYLTAATDALVWDCVLAYVSWVGYENVTAEMKAVFNENPAIGQLLEEKSEYKNYAQGLKNKTGVYIDHSWSGAFQEIASGAADIADEVGTAKIADPYEKKNTDLVESWYSWHSLDDYVNNIESIKNAYLGGTGNASRTAVSLSTYIASKDVVLDAQIKAKIEDCITKIRAIGNYSGGKYQYSFYEVVRDQINASQVQAAIDACLELGTLFGYFNNNLY